MDRRDFLKTAGLGSAVAASLPVLGGVAVADGNRTGFHFTAVSHLDSTDLVAMAGTGSLSPSNVMGGGSFVHFQPVGAPPFPIVGSGTWKATSLIGFESIGTYGSLAAGILEAGIKLVASFPERQVVPATLKVVCNIAPAGLLTGQPEGYFLTVGDATFVPFDPPLGLTVFTVENERRGG